MPPRRILIIGGSTRAAATSVRRAGWDPVCADLFADYDLQQTAETIPVRNYPESLPQDVAHVRAEGWMYCGALENHPQILSQISRDNPSLGPLLGTSPEALIALRDPGWIASIMNDAGVPCLEVADQSSPPAPDARWLQKPLASAGGRLIRVWDHLAAKNPFSEPHYFQRRATGIEVSVLFQCAEARSPLWLGASFGLSRPGSSDAPFPFAYCGSYGPVIDLSEAVVNAITAITEAVCQRTPGINGLVGLDLILEEDRIWLVEINPRYTASAEVLELASFRSFLNPERTIAQQKVGTAESLEKALSAVAALKAPQQIRQQITPTPAPVENQRRIVAKQILYTSRSIPAPDLREYFGSIDPWLVPIVADIPHVDTTIEAGWPICTVMASGCDWSSVKETLQTRSSLVRTAIVE